MCVQVVVCVVESLGQNRKLFQQTVRRMNYIWGNVQGMAGHVQGTKRRDVWKNWGKSSLSTAHATVWEGGTQPA